MSETLPTLPAGEIAAPGGVATLPTPRLCEFDRCRPLTAKQTRFASETCRKAWWDREHPRVGVVERQTGVGKQRVPDQVLALMADGRWRSGQEIADELRLLAVTADRGLRKLRAKGFNVEVSRPGGIRKPALYRIVLNQLPAEAAAE